MANGTLAPSPKFAGYDDDGLPLVSGKLYTYAAGTTTPLATYSEVTLTTVNANPIILDSAGRATIFLSPTSYKFVLKTSTDVTVWSQDNVGAVPATNIDNDVDGTAGEALTATQCVYLGAGTWSKADADSASTSTVPTIAFVVADVASASDGTFRLSGRMEGFSGLTPGSDYYVSATAGEITASAPANARYVGRADSISSLIITPNPANISASAILTGTLANARLNPIVPPTVVALSDGATPALNAALGNVFTLAAAGDRTIAVPSNPVDGQKIVIRHLASGGARTLALNSGAGGFRFGTDITALTQTASGKIDYIGCIYNGTDTKWDVVAVVKGY